ncbi:MAG: peptidylprolyl isomerase [Gammaproteobacteria bacterium]|nr:peptidylprolyl isomerase [Gammaproteobacteria bacterium]MCW8909749.1 peptidylprolyl isomerase [Gammaproteobacteria bacterium]MCW9006045.1 peptidylprolyl isomerase [Gammaproteobacteria bacterium]MCW9055416.1 peptidylprolyl isomerase [Gammaproteobacteria bacterium]
MKLKIDYDSIVTLNYRLSLEDGTEVESSFDETPLEIIIGDGTLTDGMEQALIGKNEGDTVSVSINPEQGFGFPDEDNQHAIPLDDFPSDLKPESGQIIAFDGPNNEEIPGTILEIKDKEVIVDFSHPLAGHNLIFNADIIKVQPPQE